MIAGAAFIWLFSAFRVEFKSLLNRIAKIRLPGGTEVSTSQIERSTEELPAQGKKPEPIPESGSSTPTLPTNLTLSGDQLQSLQQAFAAERARAALWEYRYLNFFLARGTQRVLDWLNGLGVRTTVSMFDSFWLPSIPSAQERQAIITALQAHSLIAMAGPVLEVTPKGKEYLAWRGPLPDEAA
jgi:hypothetical protein